MADDEHWIDKIILKPEDKARRKRYFRHFWGVVIFLILVMTWMSYYG